MKKKVAIIDHLGAHGSSHHFYLFGQAKGLIDNNVNVILYTNSATINPKIIDCITCNTNIQIHYFYFFNHNVLSILINKRYYIYSHKE